MLSIRQLDMFLSSGVKEEIYLYLKVPFIKNLSLSMDTEKDPLYIFYLGIIYG
jgi:hypothetical protein